MNILEHPGSSLNIREYWKIIEHLAKSLKLCGKSLKLTFCDSRLSCRKFLPAIPMGQLQIISKQCESNFRARYINGNIVRGIKNIHVNIRSLNNKLSEVKHFILKEKPHIFGMSETEVYRGWHSEATLKIPGYDILLPLSWD